MSRVRVMFTAFHITGVRWRFPFADAIGFALKCKHKEGFEVKTRNLATTVGTVLIAGGVGAGIALLWAPQSGCKTRRLIRRKAEDVAGELRGVAESVKEVGGDARRNMYRLRMHLTELNPIRRASS